jgi:hypothetical protein
MDKRIVVGSRVTWATDGDYWGTVTGFTENAVVVRFDTMRHDTEVKPDRITFRHNREVR